MEIADQLLSITDRLQHLTTAEEAAAAAAEAAGDAGKAAAAAQRGGRTRRATRSAAAAAAAADATQPQQQQQGAAEAAAAGGGSSCSYEAALKGFVVRISLLQYNMHSFWHAGSSFGVPGRQLHTLLLFSLLGIHGQGWHRD
jgi:hypothetical protein